jgi:Ca-activated chloride channel homolog
MIQFAQPLWIAVGLLCCISLYVAQRILQKKRQKALDQFVSPTLRAQLTQNVSTRRRGAKISLFLLSVFCCFLALARPQYGFKWVEVKHKGIDILFALDTSKSMLAEDIKPNRFERSKLAIMDFVNQLEGDRVGVLPFAGSAYLMCPLTLDYNAFEQSLNAIDTSVIPVGGTDIATAIEETTTILDNDANHKFLILITDGENLEGDTIKAAEEAAKKGMKIFTVGVGTTEGELIPITVNGKSGFRKDDTGKFITSRLDETTLTKIAEATDALYVPLGRNGEGLETIYSEQLSLIPKEEIAERRKKVPLERFEWPVAAAILFLIIEFMLGGRKSAPLKLSFSLSLKNGKASKQASAALLAILLFSVTDSSQASVGETAFENEDYLTASEYYTEALEKDPTNVKLHYNYGTTAYKNNLYDDAIASFNTALKSKDLELQERAYYNRGNAQYKKGAETQQADPQATLKQWKEAAESYKASLELAPDAKDSGHNLKLVEKKIEELEKQQEQQKNQDKEDQPKDDKQDQNQENKNENQQDQDKKEQKDNKEQQERDTSQQENQKQDEQNSEQKQGEENKKQEQQQPEEKQEAKEEKKQAAGSENKDRERDKEPEDAATASAERRELGKMTEEEAKQLLDGLKSEEDNLNFIPVAPEKDKKTRRDW